MSYNILLEFTLLVLSRVDLTSPDEHFWLAKLLFQSTSLKESEPAEQSL